MPMPQHRYLPDTEVCQSVMMSYWDNVKGPQLKMVWTHKSVKPSALKDDAVRLFMELSLKGEVSHDLHHPTIKNNYYEVHDHNCCFVSYIFSGAGKMGKDYKVINRINTLIFQLPVTSRYLAWSECFDPMVKHYLEEYRILLHKDMETHDTLCSDRYLQNSVGRLVNLLIGLKELCIDTNNSPLTDLLQRVALRIGSAVDSLSAEQKRMRLQSEGKFEGDWCDVEKEDGMLFKVTNSMMRTFKRLVIVGKPSQIDLLNMWVRTMALFLETRERQLCFYASEKCNEAAFFPNVMVQGWITEKEKHIMDTDQFLLSLYLSRYPLTILDLTSRCVIQTSTLQDHQAIKFSSKNAEALWDERASPFNMDAWCKDKKRLILRTREQHCRSPIVQGVHDDDCSYAFIFINEVIHCHPNDKKAAIDLYLRILHNKVMELIKYVRQASKTKDGKAVSHKSSSGEETFDSDLVCRISGVGPCDASVIVSLAETLCPGIYAKCDVLERESFVTQSVSSFF